MCFRRSRSSPFSSPRHWSTSLARSAAGESIGVGVRRLAIAQIVLTGIAFAALAGLAVLPSPVDGKRMWLAALPWLASATVLVWIATRSASARPVQAFSVYVAALLMAWAAVSTAGLDASPRWESGAKFAAEVDRLMPAGEPVVLEAGIEESLVYYGRRRVIWSHAREWMDTHADAPLPYFVCEVRCEGVDGSVVTEEREKRGSGPMILLRPDRRRARASIRFRSCISGPGASPTMSTASARWIA